FGERIPDATQRGADASQIRPVTANVSGSADAAPARSGEVGGALSSAPSGPAATSSPIQWSQLKSLIEGEAVGRVSPEQARAFLARRGETAVNLIVIAGVTGDAQ